MSGPINIASELKLNVPLEFGKKLIEETILEKVSYDDLVPLALDSILNDLVLDIIQMSIFVHNNVPEVLSVGKESSSKKKKKSFVIQSKSVSRALYLDASLYYRFVFENPRAKRLLQFQADPSTMSDKKMTKPEVASKTRCGPKRRAKTAAEKGIQNDYKNKVLEELDDSDGGEFVAGEKMEDDGSEESSEYEQEEDDEEEPDEEDESFVDES